MTLHETAHAKLNLALHVRAREKDGYHRIETLFAFCEDGDRLQVDEGDTLSLDVSGPFGAGLAGEDNLVMRAARALQDRFGVGAGAALRLDKRLPVASGIGGGSADAAAAIRLLVRLWEIDAAQDDLLALAAQLGADVPACLLSRTAFGTGRGDQLTTCDLDLAGTPLLLVNPRVPVPTGPVFQAWDGKDRGALVASDWLTGRNDLEAPARTIQPVIGDVLDALPASGATFTRMSGSGATCLGFYADEGTRDAAAARIDALHPSWWTLASRLR